MSSFIRKVITVQLDYAATSKTIDHLGIDVFIDKPGPPQLPTANVKIFGCSYQDMEAFTTLNFEALQYEKNTVTISAGDEGGQLAVLFKGEAKASFANFNLAPDPVLEIQAIAGFYPSRIVSGPESIHGEAPVADLCGKWAGEAGYNFINVNVSASVRDCVFNGSPLDKIQKACEYVDAFCIVDDYNIIIMAQNALRQGTTPVISKNSGMLGYPVFTNNGVRVKTLHRPDVILGSKMRIDSIVPKASGTWQVIGITHTLSSRKPDGGGPWQTEIEGFRL